MLTCFRRQLVITVLIATSIFMALLIVQQGRIIDSQRVLIQQLFKDSQELSAMKVQHIQARIKK